MLDDIEAEEIPQLLVLNKIDVVDPLTRRRLSNRYPDAVLVSARTGENLDELKRRVAAFFAERYVDVRLLVPHDRGAALSALYETGAPITSREDSADGRPGHRPPAAAARQPIRVVPGGRQVTIDLPVKVLDPAARIPDAAVRRRRRPRPGERGGRGDPARRPDWASAPGWRSQSRRGMRGSCSRARGWPSTTASPC